MHILLYTKYFYVVLLTTVDNVTFTDNVLFPIMLLLIPLDDQRLKNQ